MRAFIRSLLARIDENLETLKQGLADALIGARRKHMPRDKDSKRDASVYPLQSRTLEECYVQTNETRMSAG